MLAYNLCQYASCVNFYVNNKFVLFSIILQNLNRYLRYVKRVKFGTNFSTVLLKKYRTN